MPPCLNLRTDDILILSNPPICEDEWGDDGEVHEATITPFPGGPGQTDPPSKRIAAGSAAGKDVRKTNLRQQKVAVGKLLRRLAALREKLEATILKGTTFRASQVSQLISAVDREIADATADLAALARVELRAAADLGSVHVDETVIGAKLRPLVTTGVTSELVTAAGDATADLLTAPMQQYRRRIVTQVRRLAVQGSDFGTEWQALSKVLDKAGFQNAEFASERIVRTELSRVFNQATHDRMVQQAATMPFLRKGWVRVLDGRTRETHKAAGERYARGTGGIPVVERFAVGKASMRFPVDPLTEPAGQVAASETILCRCTGITLIDAAGIRQATADRVALAMGGR